MQLSRGLWYCVSIGGAALLRGVPTADEYGWHGVVNSRVNDGVFVRRK